MIHSVMNFLINNYKSVFVMLFFLNIIVVILVQITFFTAKSAMKQIKKLKSLITVSSKDESEDMLYNKIYQLETKIDSLIGRIKKNQKEPSADQNVERALYIANDSLGNIEQNFKLLSENFTQLSNQLGQASSAGSFGEYSLEQTLKLIGLSYNQDYKIQEVLDNNSRPDATVIFGKYKLFIDAKTSIIGSGHSLIESGKMLQNKYKKHIRSLASKAYHNRPNSLPFSLMYLPSDSLLIQLIQSDPSIIHEAQQYNIFFSSPTMLPIIIMFIKNAIHTLQDNY